MTDEVSLLSTAEAARRLGVKPATLYAYVSRGLLARVRGADGRTSFFDPAELDQMAQQPRTPVAAAGGGVSIRSAISEVRDQRLWYRGRDACEMARTDSFEAVAGWLWSEGQPPLSFTGPAEFVDAARAAAGALPHGTRLLDRIRAIVAAVSAVDPLRADLRPEAVMITAATLIGALVDGLPRQNDTDATPGSVAHRLWSALTALPAEPTTVASLNTALGLLADHTVTASTVAARVAASARAHPYAAIGGALYTLDGPVESGTAPLVHRTLAEAERDGAVTVVARLLDQANQLPGFGHPLYPDGDPRGRTLIDVLAAEPPHRGRWEAVEQFLATGRRGRPLAPTIDFGVAALTFTAGMPADAGLAILAIARCAGWVAHTLEEYGEEPDRFRPSAEAQRRTRRQP
ncbi:citrate synthase [Cryptosporangium aurantiacum]|uniref:citrate synthase (unknown stereospecificity) n=1 Tax=Cryptosporangium aurantiacum TaxID=134849 RepID=A0A1M7RKY1_9ACTN|nr:citrate synthase [Cryptosporangium aurantiacum]SHN46822.1 citrate synthase [Cryptosporangium aurantiacum]